MGANNPTDHQGHYRFVVFLGVGGTHQIPFKDTCLRYGDICIRIADSLCYTAETNTPL